MKRSIKSQVILSVVLIAICSILATFFTYIVVSRLLPAHEQSVEYATEAQALMKKLGVSVMSPTNQRAFEKVLPLPWAKYQVMTATGQPLYGSESRRLFSSKAAVVRALNVRSVVDQGGLFRASEWMLSPILNARGNLVGAVYEEYPLRVRFSTLDPSWLQGTIMLLLLATPFIFIGLFTYLFARRLSKNVNKPIALLIQAAQKIQQRDLDFRIEYQGQNELGQLVNAFEDMRQGLRDSLIRQWALEDERRNMLSAISHDVRTPITIISGHAEMLQEIEDIPAHARKYADAILRNAKRVARLMSDFHAVTDVDSPHFVLRPVAVDIPAFVSQKAVEYDAWAEKEGVQIKLSLTDARGQTPSMRVDSDRLAQIVDNIVGNAIRFTPQGGVIDWRVTIADDEIYMSIHDSGAGFHPGDVDKVFRKFYQGDASRSSGKEHSGLGLYIVQALIEKHGGTVRVRNDVNGGGVVEFSIRAI